MDKILTDLDDVFLNDFLADTFVDKLLGRAGRLAYLIPSVRPFVGMLWAAKTAADRHHNLRRARSARQQYPAKRFAHAAAWIRVLLRPPSWT